MIVLARFISLISCAGGVLFLIDVYKRQLFGSSAPFRILRATEILSQSRRSQKFLLSAALVFLASAALACLLYTSVDDEAMYNDIRNYIRLIEPEKEKIVKLYRGNVDVYKRQPQDQGGAPHDARHHGDQERGGEHHLKYRL